MGSNDGFLHAFDGGVWDRDTANFPGALDLGTGREIFAYSPRQVMSGKFPNLLNFPPLPQYFVDGSMATADVFIDPVFGANPDPTERVWRTVLVGALRQGGAGYYGLDVTQPDEIVTGAGPTQGNIIGSKDASPRCIDGSGASCVAGSAANRRYPEILWEFTDAGADCSDACGTVAAPLGETWSRPVVGRIRTFTGSGGSAAFEDRYVAMFGGGFDPSFTAGDDIAAKLPKGRAFYMVDVETGKILFKATQGVNGSGANVNFAPAPSAPSVVDYDDDGYLDILYLGDVNGNMWRINLTADATSGIERGQLQADDQLHNYQPFLLYDGCGVATGACTNHQPIFYDPAIIFIGGGVEPPAFGIAWGTGNRAELARPNSQRNSFYYVIDTGQTDTTFSRNGAGAALLRDISPGAAGTNVGPCPTPFDPTELRERQQSAGAGLLSRLRDRQREDHVDRERDPGIPVGRDVHAGLRQPVRHQRQLVPVSLLLPDRHRVQRPDRHVCGLPGHDGSGRHDGLAVDRAVGRYNRHVHDVRIGGSGAPPTRKAFEYDETKGVQSTREKNWKEQQ